MQEPTWSKALSYAATLHDEARHFLQEKLAELKDRVEKSEAALHRYRQDRGIISLDNRENIVVDRLADLNKRLTEAEADRIGLEAQTRLIHKNEYNALPAVIDNRLIQMLKIELTRLEGERADLATKVQPGDPVLGQFQARVEQTKRRLQQEIQRTIAGIKSAYAVAKQKEDELRAKMEQQKTLALGLKDAAVDYAILAREVDTNRQLYDSVLSRLKEMEVAAVLRASNVSVIDEAVPPVKPVRPRKALSLLLSAVLGLTGGVGLAFVVEHCTNTLRTSQEVERYLRLPNLGIIPDFVSSARRSSLSSQPASPGAQPLDGSAAQAGFVLAHDPFSITTEAYRILRTTLLVAQAETPPKTLLFTSGMHGEGKTVTAVNTAAVLAQMGVRVLVIDADLRCSACHTVLGIENKSGLAEVLAGRWDPSDVIRPTVSEHLFVLSSGSVPRNPAELVGSKQMRTILASLQEQYDYILIDSPPVMLASDAMLLSTMVDGVVLVANAQRTPKQVVREARTRLTCAQAKILGVVLNQLIYAIGSMPTTTANTRQRREATTRQGDTMCLMPVEAATDDRRDGQVFCSADELLTGQRQWQGLWVSAPEVEFGYLLAKKALQGAITVQQKPRLQELRQELGTKAEAITQRLFGSRLGARVTQWMTTENWTALECHLPRLRRALLWQALWHDPLNLLRYWIPEGAQMWRQWRYPQHYRAGHNVSPLRPGQERSRLRRRGGLLLLVLVCMTTGCTGSRAREKAAVTAPPAPEKVVVNRVSSSKTKLSTLPRNKAKAPVTTGQPGATTASPPQQGEEQEGRVF